MRRSRILQAVAGVACVMALCASCDDEPKVGLYQFDLLDHGCYVLKIYHPDSSYIDTTHVAGTAFRAANRHNLWCLDSASLWKTHDGDTDSAYDTIYSLFVHRPSGRVDTLFLSYIYGATGLGFGHIHRSCFLDGWIILECRLPGRILGHSHLYDEADSVKPIDQLDMNSYTYDGQRLIFESKDFDYWVINRMTTDFYGPLTEQQLVAQLAALGIALPVTLQSEYFPYEELRDKDDNLLGFPDSLYTRGFWGRYYPHGKAVEPKVIEAK